MDNSLPVSVQLRIDEVCARFEAAWQAAGADGPPPRLEQFVGAATGRERAALLRELLRLDLHYRHARGERHDACDYAAGWPDHADVIRALLADLPTAPQPPPPAARSNENTQAALPASPAAVPHYQDLRDSVRELVREYWAGQRQDHRCSRAELEEAVLVNELLRDFWARHRAVPGYELFGELGRGAMGVVYRARQTALKRLVALKMLHPGEGTSGQLLERFRREAEAVARLHHPNIVQVYEVGEHDGQPYLALELVEGGSLAAKLRESLPEPKAAAALVEKLARAMHAAHQRQVVHRDLKPANVLLTADGEPKITDFGLAKQLDADAGLTHPGAVMGTPSYMAREQAEGRLSEVGPLSDQYSLGAILYEMLTGRPPFRAATVAQTLRQVVEEEPVPPRRLNPTVPRDLETVCLKCLQKEPLRRYGSAAELAEDLRRFRQHEPIRARPVGMGERVIKWVRRKPLPAALWFSVIVITLVGAAGTGTQYFKVLEQKTQLQQESLGKDLAIEAEAEESRLKGIALAEKEEESRLKGIALENEKKAVKQATEAKKTAQEQLHRYRCAAIDRQFFELANVYRQNAARAQEMLQDTAAFPLDLRDFAWGLYYRWSRRDRLTIPSYAPRLLPDGRTLICGGYKSPNAFGPVEEPVVRLIDLATGQTLTPPWGDEVSKPEPAVVAATADGKTLAWPRLNLAHLPIRLWDRGSGRKEDFAETRFQTIDGMAFTPDGKRLVAWGTRDLVKNPVPHTLIAWEVPAGKGPVSAELPGTITSVAFSPDSRWVAVVVSKQLPMALTEAVVLLWDPSAGGAPRALGSPTTGLAILRTIHFSDDGKSLVTVRMDGVVTVWDTAGGKEKQSVSTGMTGANVVAFAPGARAVALTSNDETAFWGLTGNAPLRTSPAMFTIPEGVWAVTYSPDGKLLAWGGRNGGLKLRAADDGRVLDTLDDSLHVDSVAFTPDGRRLITGCGTAGIKVWDVYPDEGGRALAGHGHVVTAVAFGPDGSALASGSLDHTAKLWDPRTGRERATFVGHADAVTAVGLSGDGTLLASASRDGTVRLWDARTGQERAVLRGHDGWVRSLAFAAGQPLLASGGEDGTVRLWDAAVARVLAVLEGHKGSVLALAFRPGGKVLASAGADGTARLWDVATRKELHTLDGHAGEVSAAAFSPDGATLVTGSGGQDDRERWFGEVTFWDADTGRRRQVVRGHTGFVRSVAFSPDGKTLATAGDRDVLLWDPYTGQQRAAIPRDGRSTLPEGWQVRGVAFDSQGSTLAVAGGWRDDEGQWHGEVRLWAADTGPERATVHAHRRGTAAVAVTADGKGLVTAGASEDAPADGSLTDEVKLWDAVSGEARAAFRIPRTSCVALAGDGNTLAWEAKQSGGDPRLPELWVKLWDVAAGKERATLPVPNRHWVLDLTFSRDRTTVAAIVSSNTGRHPFFDEASEWDVQVWDVATGKERGAFPFKGPGIACCLSPDGKTFAVPLGPGDGEDRGVAVWDAAGGKQVGRYRGEGMASCLAFSPDGQTLAAGAGSVELWDVKSGASRRLSPRGKGPLRALAFSPDGTTLAAVNETVTVWDVATGREMATFPGAAPLAFTPNGKTLIVGSRTNGVTLWDLAAATVRHGP
jgi:WD40 repeat protein